MTCIRNAATGRRVFCYATIVTLATIVPIAAQGQVKPNVTVVNPVSSPVNARITNTVVPVEISNADAIPVVPQESEGSRQIFAKTITVDMGGGAGNCNGTDPLTVPAGKRLVIQYVSASTSFTSPAALVDVSLGVLSGPGPQIVVPAGKSAPGGGNVTYASAGQNVHAYSDVALFACAKTSDPTSEELQVNVMGYYVDKPGN